jgi:hypothetical protein
VLLPQSEWWNAEISEILNNKSQISNNKQMTITKIQNSKHVCELEEQ